MTEKRGEFVSRFRLHKAKCLYWNIREQISETEAIIDDGAHLGDLSAEDRARALDRLATVRSALLAKKDGIELVFDQFDLSLDRRDVPKVTDEQIRTVSTEIRPTS